MALMLLLASCGEEKDVRTAIPRDARAVLAVDWASMAEKGGLADLSVSQPLTEWMSRTVSADDKEYVEDLMADPGKSGIDFRQKLYAFTNDKKDVGVLMKIDSKKRFKRLLRHIDEAWADAAWESEGGADCLELPEGVIVVDDDMAMMVSSAGDATTEAMRMRGVRWLEQKPEESFTATGSCVAMEEDSADVALWCTLGALFDVTGNQALAANLPRDVRPDDIHCLMCLDFDRAMRLNASIRPMSDAAEAYCDEQGRMVKPVKGTFLPDASAPFWLWAASSVDGQQLARLLERNAEMKQALDGAAFGFNVRKLLASIDNDVTFVVGVPRPSDKPLVPPSLALQAELANDSILDDMDAMAQMLNLLDVEMKKEAPGRYSLKPMGVPTWIGVDADRRFFCATDENLLSSGGERPDWAEEAVGSSFYLRVNMRLLGNLAQKTHAPYTDVFKLFDTLVARSENVKSCTLELRAANPGENILKQFVKALLDSHGAN